MYKISILKTARDSLAEIVHYHIFELKNPAAARNLVEEMDKGLEKLAAFPYACPKFTASLRLKRTYRKLLVKNYVVLYWVNEEAKEVIVEQIVYARRDMDKLTQ